MATVHPMGAAAEADFPGGALSPSSASRSGASGSGSSPRSAAAAAADAGGFAAAAAAASVASAAEGPPDLSHLTEEERAIIESVMHRHQSEESKEVTALRYQVVIQCRRLKNAYYKLKVSLHITVGPATETTATRAAGSASAYKTGKTRTRG